MHRSIRTTAALTALTALAMTTIAACGSSKSSTSGGAKISAPVVAALSTLGAAEKELNIIAWAGYAENGSNDPNVNWVKPFEDKTGCKTNVKVGNTSDEMVQLMKTGEYDGVSASGDATLRLIAGGDVAPVNTDLVPNYKTIFDFLKNQQYNSANGKAYGIPHGWGANLLMYNTDTVKPAPTSWGAVFDANSPYKGKITAYDSPIYIADGALYLMKTKPALGIKNPYALDQTQFDAVVALMKSQKALIGEYWSDYLKAQEAFTKGSLVLGTTWQVIVNGLTGAKEPVKVAAVLPSEGSTAWSDTWMISSKAKHPNCMYLWFDWITSPEVNAQVAEYFGEAPAQSLACDKTAAKDHCAIYKANDEAFHRQLWYWTSPTKECLDGRGAKCVDYAEWTKAWDTIKG